MEKTIYIVGILLALLLLTGASMIGLMNIRSCLENDLEDTKADVTEWKHEADKWLNMYLNYECPECPECPEPEVIIKIINNTIWNNQTIYIDNAVFDVNRDCTVDYLDCLEVAWYIRNGITFIEDIVFNKFGNPYEKLYDVDCNGYVNYDDVDLIWQYRN